MPQSSSQQNTATSSSRAMDPSFWWNAASTRRLPLVARVAHAVARVPPLLWIPITFLLVLLYQVYVLYQLFQEYGCGCERR
jgi:hypothetical protein